MGMKIRTLIVDDSVFYRGILSDLLRKLDSVELLGNAMNGSMALSKIEQLAPDLVTLDVEMPGMDGLTVLREIRGRFPKVQVVMISSATTASAKVTIDALEEGALDFIEKPNEGCQEANERQLYRQLRRIINVVETKLILNRGIPETTVRTVESVPVAPQIDKAPFAVRLPSGPIEIVAIGISTGGPGALPAVLENLPGSFHLPVLIVQHMPAMFVTVLVESLSRRSKIPVMEAVSNSTLQGGIVYLAPGGKQMKIVRAPGKDTPTILLTDDPPENFCRPSVDYLFRSVAKIYGGRTLAVIMTGMGKDGVAGLKLLKESGATIYAQDQQSSVVYGMASEAVNAGVIDTILPLKLIGENIVKRVRQGSETNYTSGIRMN